MDSKQVLRFGLEVGEIERLMKACGSTDPIESLMRAIDECVKAKEAGLEREKAGVSGDGSRA